MKNKVKISVIVLAKNEARRIGRCLASLKWANEILVIDDYSQDATVRIARQRGARVLRHHLENFAAQRNWALQQAKYPWVFFVDADEKVPPSLANEIVRRVQERGAKAFAVRRQDIFQGHKLRFGENAHNSFIRLAKKNAGRWQGLVHERWRINGKVRLLKCPLEHRLPSLAELLRKINFYTDLRAKELQQKKKTVSWFAIMLYPLAKFCRDYCFWRGFRDGTAGLVMAMLMAFHSFLVRAKLWQSYHEP